MLGANLKCKRVYFKLFFFIMVLLNAYNLYAANVTLSWIPPTTKADGTPLTDLAGYKIYYGLSSGNYTQHIDIGNVTSYTVTNLSTGTAYYFATTAYDTSSNESSFSNEVRKTIAVVTYYCDKDNDGYISTSVDGTCTGTGCEPAGCRTTAGNDCNDNNVNIKPNASDTSCNGIDDNCNGQVDEGYLATATTCGVGACISTGIQQCINGQLMNTCTAYSPSAEICDGLDNNCDGQIDEVCSPAISVSKVLLSEDFSNGIPNTWGKTGNWNTDNTCEKTISSPFVAPFAIADSSCTVTGTDELITPTLDTTSCDSVELAFSNQHHLINGNVEVTISDDGGANWVNTASMPLRDGYPDPNWKNIDLSTIVNTNEANIKFSYESNTSDEFWALDNIWVTCQPTQLEFSSTILKPSSTNTILISNTGVTDLSVNTISIDGADAINFTISNNGCSNQTLQPAESCILDIIYLPTSDGPKSAILSISSNDPDTPILNMPLTGPGTEIINPNPTVKVKGSKGKVSIKQGGKDPNITLELTSGSYEGTNSDYWLLMQRNNKWYYYDPLNNKWRRGLENYSQGTLTDKTTIVTPKNTSNLPKGLYNLYFGLDTNMDGSQDPEQYYYDKMKVRIW